MKNHSSNIQIEAGWAVIFSANAFPNNECSLVGFRQSMGTLACVVDYAITSRVHASEDKVFTILQLSLPRFEVVGNRQYKLVSPFFCLGEFIFRCGAVLVFDDDGKFVSPISKTISKGSVVLPVFKETEYDTYNGEDALNISQDMRKGLDIDQETTSELCTKNEDLFSTVKALSIYVADFPENDFEVWGGYTIGSKWDKEPLEGITAVCAYGDGVISTQDRFDCFAIKFTSTEQPFAYICVESYLGEEQDDTFADKFDEEVLKDFKASPYNTTPAKLIERYRSL